MIAISLTAVLRNGFRFLVPLSVVLTVYLYLYPIFNTCAFPLPPTNGSADGVDTGLSAFRETAKLQLARFLLNTTANGSAASVPDLFVPDRPLAPFRLLALGDPQLEGDTSIPNAYRDDSFPHLTSILRDITFKSEHSSIRARLRQILHDAVDFYFEDIPDTLESIRKRIDLIGNDFYLSHIFHTLRWWTRPTHVTVLGDLLGSQWVDKAEFDRRAERYWNRVFRDGVRVPDELARGPSEEYDLSGYLGGSWDNDTEAAWTRRIINVAGNHDIGYAGDINDDRVSRFEHAFGRVNYELRFELPLTNATLAETVYDEVKNRDSTRLVPELRILVVNDMNLDTPAASTELQDETYSFINNAINTATAVEFKGHYTVVLTHVPFHKPEGICADAPYFDFHDDGTLREQNLLSDAASKGFLEGIFGMSGDTMAPGNGRGRAGIVLNGHDHVGCDTWHFVNQTYGLNSADRDWQAMRWRQAKRHGVPGKPGLPGVREITVRSMMGDYGGNAGLLSLWFDPETWEWKSEYTTCPLGTQHLWWVVHIVDLITVIVGLVYALVLGLAAVGVNVDKLVANLFWKPSVASGGKAQVSGNGKVKKAEGGPL
jgi:hypothetical protein